jgi:F0F1-type ATP synthase membrane subunit b/b'
VERELSELRIAHDATVKAIRGEHATALDKAKDDTRATLEMIFKERLERLEAEKERLRADVASSGSEAAREAERRLREQLEVRRRVPCFRLASRLCCVGGGGGVGVLMCVVVL